MKNKLFTLIFGAILFVSCNQKEMKISRSDFSVQTEMTDFSPAYISKNKEGKAELNKNNLIGNTHWVLSVDRDLKLDDIAPFLQELTDKKHKKDRIHEDSKDIYFVYSDTVHKQNAYVKLPFEKIITEFPPVIEPEMDVRYLNGAITDLEDFRQKFSESTAIEEPYRLIFFVFSKEMKVDEFVNILIELEKQKLSESLNSEVYVN